MVKKTVCGNGIGKTDSYPPNQFIMMDKKKMDLGKDIMTTGI